MSVSDLQLSHAATHLLGSLFLALDTRAYHDVAACFVSDGIWHRQGRKLKGETDIVAALEMRPPGRKTLHVTTNIVVASASLDEAKAVFYLTAYRYDGDSESAEPAPIVAPIAMGPCEVRLVLASGCWRIAELKTGPDYMFKATAGP